MAEKIEQAQSSTSTILNGGGTSGGGVKVRKSPEFQASNVNVIPGVISRERSFVRTSNQQNINKRRSLAFNVGNQTGQLRGRPAMDIYRPPNVRSDALNKLNVNAQEFTMSTADNASLSSDTDPTESMSDCGSSMIFPLQSPTGLLTPPQQQQQQQYMANRRQAGLSLGNVPLNSIGVKGGHHRSILVTHSHPISPLASGSTLPLLNSTSSGNILHTTNANRVKFAAEPQKLHHHKSSQLAGNGNNSSLYQQQQQQLAALSQYQLAAANGGLGMDPYMNGNALQRSKSLSSADALTRGMAGLGLGLGNEVADIGQFSPEVQALIETALEDPNTLNSRSLMELTSHFIKRAVEGRRFALPISRLCLNIIAREQKETFLEALLNTCRQWYQEREKLLFAIQGMKSPSRVRFTAFMAFLTEMFCQLKRRQLQLRTQSEGAPPPLILLTLLSKCCEDCVRPPVRSLSEIECLFYVLTCIGQDMELQLPQQLELLMSLVRDAFLNAGDSAPAIRRTLLQLIELKASHWQLPGNTVLYYYPTK